MSDGRLGPACGAAQSLTVAAACHCHGVPPRLPPPGPTADSEAALLPVPVGESMIVPATDAQAAAASAE